MGFAIGKFVITLKKEDKYMPGARLLASGIKIKY